MCPPEPVESGAEGAPAGPVLARGAGAMGTSPRSPEPWVYQARGSVGRRGGWKRCE